MAKILVVEDDFVVATLLLDSLKAAGHTVEHVDDGREGLDRMRLYQYELVILDRNLPEMEGVEILQEYRGRGGAAPVLMLTGLSQVSHRTEGLDAGADDYLTKPFALEELLSRVRALLRRPVAASVTDKLTARDIVLDAKSGTVTKGGAELVLQRKEFVLLEFFLRHPNQIYSAEDLLQKIWSSESDASADAVRQCLLRLRKKIDGDSSTGELIKTIKGFGYKLEI